MKNKVLEITVYDDNTVRLIVNGQERHCTRIEFNAEVGEVPQLVTSEPVYRNPNAVQTVYVDGKEFPTPPNATREYREPPRRKRGRPRKKRPYSDQPIEKRPVGRPRKITNQEIEAGDFVRLIPSRVTSIGAGFADYEDMINGVHKVKRKVDSSSGDCGEYWVFRPDNISSYLFCREELELVRKGDKK